MARRLIEAGVRLVSVTAWAGLPPGEKFRNVQTWDMHGEGAGLGSMFGKGAFGLGWALPNLDLALSQLLIDLEERGLLDSTLVVVVGEFGRSPKIVRAGRDHWPACYSCAPGRRRHPRRPGPRCLRSARRLRPRLSGPTRAVLRDAVSCVGCAARDPLAPDGFTRPASAGEPVMALFESVR